MADEPIAAAGQPAASEPAPSADSQSDPKSQSQDPAVTQEQKPADKTASEVAAQEQAQVDGKKAESKDPADQTKSDGKPRSRRSAAFRIHQLTQEIKDLKAQKAGKDGDQGDDDTDPADDKKPDIAALVQQEVAKHLKPLETANTKAADDAELTELFAGKPEEKAKYEGKIRDMWNLPHYKDLSAEDLYKIASYEDAMAKGAEEIRKADAEARASSSTASSAARTSKTGKSVLEMTPEEFQQHNEKIKAKL